MLCRAVFRRAVPCSSVVCCGALCSVVPCRAVSCGGVSCRGAAGCAVLCRVAPRRVVVCRVLGCLVVVRCTAVRCGAVCRVALCWALYRFAVVCGGLFLSPFWRGVGSALVRLVRFVVRDAGRSHVAGWWPGGCGLGGVDPCCGGPGVVLWSVGQAGVRGVTLCGGLCPLGDLAPSLGCRGRVLFLFWCLCGGPCIGRGRRLAVRAWCSVAWRCSRRLPRWV